MGPLSSLVVVTSYWLPIVTIGLSVRLSPFSQCSDLSRTDRRTDGISSKRRHYALKLSVCCDRDGLLMTDSVSNELT